MSNPLLYKEHYTQNREISWLRFNDRVLNEAKDNSVPILERLRFVSIFTSNLQEFLMIRVGSLDSLKNVKQVIKDSRSGLTPAKQLEKIYQQIDLSLEKRDKIFNAIIKKLANKGIIMMKYQDLNKENKKYLTTYFNNHIKPFISPQIVDSHHPFPNMLSGMVQVVCLIENKGKESIGIVPLAKEIPSIIALPSKNKIRFISTAEVIENNLNQLFVKSKIKVSSTIMITRNADVNPDDETLADIYDYRKKIMKALAERKKMSIIHVLVSNNIDSKLQKGIVSRLKVDNKIVDTTAIPLDINFCSDLAKLIKERHLENLMYEPYTPKLSNDLNYNEKIFDQILKKDIILHYPYQSMTPFLKLIEESALDPDVVSIKITIYRLASNARLVEYLCLAAENGKEVVVLIELKARFDEQNNIDYSKRLEEAGCTILYGFENYKVHSKITQITRKRDGNAQIVTQIGTGNYNENTAKAYVDLAYFTANKKIAKDSQNFFNNMMIGNLEGEYSHLLVAPVDLKKELINLMEKEIEKGSQGRIWIKCNSITDSDLIQVISKACKVQVDVKLIVRGICCLLPKVANKTDNLVIRNVVGRYLEHSRIYIFGKDNSQVYISSADLMTRNTERRVEVASPIMDEKLAQEVIEIFELYLKDNLKAREMSKYGAYKKIEHQEGEEFSVQQYLMDNTIASQYSSSNKGKVISSFKAQINRKK